MLGFLLRRVVWAVFLCWASTIIVYILFWIVPADPAGLRSHSLLNYATAQEVRHYLHLDEPIWKQYLLFFWSLVGHASLGYSFVSRQPVNSIIGNDVPVTASLVLGGAMSWLALSIPIGILSALKPRSVLDRISMTFVLVGISAHPVWIGLILSYVFGYKLGLTPIAGYCNLLSPEPGSSCSGPVQWAYHLLLPWIAFMLLFAALYVRLIRAGVMETLGEDYVRTARAKGASERRVLVHHVLRNCALPVVTILGMDIGLALGGAIFTETVFALPGLGHEIVAAYDAGDSPLITGIILFAAFCVVLLNLVVDIVYMFLDPRIRLSVHAPL